MPVSLPTAADVRKARAQSAEAARTPLLAVLGAGDFAYTEVTKAVVEARTRAAERSEVVTQRVAALPQRFTPESLRELVAELRTEAEERYGYFARRGESTWGRLRKQPQVKQAITTIEGYTEKLDARVDDFVGDAHDAAEKALATVTRQTRSTGEKAARTTQRVADRAAGAVAEAGKDVAEAGEDVAKAIDGAGDEVAAETRSVTRRAANRTAPKTADKAAPKTTAARKPAAKRSTNGSASS